MFYTQLKLIIRLFLKDRIYSLLNLLGLTLGITVGIIVLLFLQFELNYDTHLQRKDEIYRFSHHLQGAGADFNYATVSRRLGPILKDEVPEVLDMVRFAFYPPNTLVTVGEGSDQSLFYENEIAQVDSTFFNLFDHKIYEGNERTCLIGPGKIVLTRSIADKYFGSQSALGQVIILPDDDKRIVSAVISDVPENSHYRYEILLSQIEKAFIPTNETRASESFWNGDDCYTYLLLPKDYQKDQFLSSFEPIFKKYYSTFGKVISADASATPKIQPITKVHFHSAGIDDGLPAGNLKYVFTFATVGFFIVLLACINYMNMATARSVIRTKEIGIRKVLGNSKYRLFISVLSEAVVLAGFAMLLSLSLSYIILEFTPFNSLIERNLELNIINNPLLIVGSLGISLTVGIVSGLYPALYIPAIPVIKALRGSLSGQKSGVLLRRVLIIFSLLFPSSLLSLLY